MVTNYEVEAFLNAMRDEGPEVHAMIKDFLKLLDDANNPDLAGVRARLRGLMQRDDEIGKHRKVWALFAPWLAETAEPAKPAKTKGKIIEDLGVTPP